MIRAATPADAAAIAAVHVRAWQETYPGIVPAELLARMTDPAFRLQQWERALAPGGPPTGLFVAELDGPIVGFGSCGPQDAPLGTDGLFRALYLLRVVQRRGLGRGLMQAMADWLIGAGIRSAGLRVAAANRPARCFYAALGGVEGAAQERDGLEELPVTWANLHGLRSP